MQRMCLPLCKINLYASFGRVTVAGRCVKKSEPESPLHVRIVPEVDYFNSTIFRVVMSVPASNRAK
jgi:hypothetical protein